MNQQFDPNSGLLVPPTLNFEGSMDHKATCQCRKCGDGQRTDNRSAAADDADAPLVPPSLYDR